MKRPTLGNLVLLAASVLVAVVASEVILRVFLDPRVTAGEAGLFEFHPRLGWQFAPNGRATIRIPDGLETAVTINAHGMRDRSYPLARSPGTQRIAVLGDSFLVGFGVEEADLLTTRLEQALLEDAEVLNFGVNGYGPLQEYLLVEERVRPFRPDLVILLLYLGNDLDDLHDTGGFTTGYQRPRARVEGGSLVIEAWPVPPRPLDRLLFGLWRFRVYELAIRAGRRIGQAAGSASTATESDPVPLLRTLLAETARSVAAFGGEFVVIAAPPLDALPSAEPSRAGNADATVAEERAALATVCQEIGLECVDLTPSMELRAAAGQVDYFPMYRHWNAQGHDVAARAISDYLRTRGPSDESSTAPGAGATLKIR